MITALCLAVATFLATVPWGQGLVGWLQSHKIGKQIRVDGPPGHQVKRGTPTMGGALFLAPVLIFGSLLAWRTPRLWAPLAVTLAFGMLGAVDDLRGLRDVQGVGWLARWKFPWQVLLGLAGGALLYLAGAPSTVLVPFAGWRVNLGLGYIPAAAFVIVSMANAVNLNDGLDGLAGGTSAAAFAAFGAMVLTGARSDVPLGLLCAVFVGGILAFLWYNVHPARMIMGDLGALALGAGLAAVALMTEQWLLLPLVGALFVLEVVSVILQVGYFKLTHGRRILRMAPLHCHFELCGWPETQIVLRSWIVAILLGVLGVALAIMR
ncbi:MAG TPA: phospho-N-acetylmuramoyl-pentapeptide-transferase [Anaerolineae bacterium]|nr:phospho-N-acetylmuramoyl-pentapeptide-transferase [Anaerolineae bacterium]HOQ99627.1 phospho-N-acetylmuramoyl-pentapeptide-transferase [Anaerolineae bacterium]